MVMKNDEINVKIFSFVSMFITKSERLTGY